MAKLMNWHIFEEKMKEKRLLLFSAFDVRKIFPISETAATFLLYRYAQKNFIRRAKRGLYVFPDMLPPDLYMANKLYEPSYLSLEFALSYHRIIPENVYEITSVTPKATRRFEALGKIYSYRRMNRRMFTGYAAQKQKSFSFIIADAEKAFVDTLYYRLFDGRKQIDRFDKTKINRVRALRYAKLFNSEKLTRLIITSLQ